MNKVKNKILEEWQSKHNICPNCPHYKICKEPCPPVKWLLTAAGGPTLEKPGRQKGVTIIFNKSRRETNSTSLLGRQDEPKLFTKQTDTLFSTERESPFLSGKYNIMAKQTVVFLEHFFNKMSFVDIAAKYDLTDGATAFAVYKRAVDRVKEILEFLETEKRTRLKLVSLGSKLEDLTSKFPDDQKYFLLNKLFDMTPYIISRLTKLDGKKVEVAQIEREILKVSDLLRTGELTLYGATPKEIEESGARLERRRKQLSDAREKRKKG